MKKSVICFILSLSVMLTVFAPAAYAGDGLPFTDVDRSQWFFWAVCYTYENSVFTGTSETTFSPSLTMTRAMVVTALYRLGGKPEVEGKKIFDDVGEGTWYTDAVEWAYDNHIVNGVNQTSFAPSVNITREQLATIIFRYAEFKGYDLSASHSLGCFLDRGTVSEYAADAFRWAVGRGLISGVTSEYLIPGDGATRAQVATILMRFALCYDSDPSNDPFRIADTLDIDPEEILTVGGKNYYIDMSADALVNRAGHPAEVLATVKGYDWYVYGIETYDDFFMAGVYEGKIVALMSEGISYIYNGERAGDAGRLYSTDDVRVSGLFDHVLGAMYYGVLIESYYAPDNRNNSQYALSGEAKVEFHLVNAFRHFHCVPLLYWSSPAATAARLHSQEMADCNYFSYVSLDGRRIVDRLNAQGISLNYYGEIICAGDRSGIGAHASVVNSSLLRETLYNMSFRYIGIGAAYNQNSQYGYYYSENYFA